MPVLDNATPSKIDSEDASLIRKWIRPKLTTEQTYVIAVVTTTGYENRLLKIDCDRGTPVGGHVYENDCYLISGVDFRPLGYIPVSFKLEAQEARFWSVQIPVPEDIIKKYLNDKQRENLESFQTVYKDEEYKIQYLQLIGC